jgi:hypothetical protein
LISQEYQMGLGKGAGRGGRRPGAGRPRKPRPVPSITEVAPELGLALTGIHALLEAQGASLARLQQQRRNEHESGPAILRRLTELERLVRGNPGLGKPPRHTRARPLGVE